MSTRSYTRGANRPNGKGASLRFGKGHDYDHWKKPKSKSKKQIKYKKVAKKTVKPVIGRNEMEMKLASKLYKKLKKEPDFKHLPWKELWDLALDEVKRNAK